MFVHLVHKLEYFLQHQLAMMYRLVLGSTMQNLLINLVNTVILVREDVLYMYMINIDRTARPLIELQWHLKLMLEPHMF